MPLQPRITALAQAVGADVKAIKTDVAALQVASTNTTNSLTGLTPVISPTTGDIQTWTLAGNSTPTLGTWANGEAMVLQISYGTFTVSWSGITWWTDTGLAPDPSKSANKTVAIALWKVGSTVYGRA